MTTRYAILVLIMAAQTMACIGPMGIPAIAPLIRTDLGLTLTQAGSFVSAYYVGSFVMSLPAGTMADRTGIRPTLVLGQLVIAAGLFAVSASGSYGPLIVLMMLAGVGYGLMNPTSTKAVMAWAPPAQRATMVGFKQVGLPFGGALGAALLPIAGVAFGWRVAVVLSGVVIAVMAVISWLLYRDPPDFVAAAQTGSRGAIATVLLTRDLWLVAIATGVFAATQTVLMAFLVLYLQEHVHVSFLAAGRYLAIAQAAGMAGRIGFGLLSDRVFGGGRRAPLAVAGLGSALCSIAIAVTGPGASAVWVTALVLVFGFVGIGWNGVQHTLMAELAGPKSAGTAVGLGLAVSSAGVSLGPPVFGWCVERAGGYIGPWIGLAVTMIVGVALLAPVREPRRRAFDVVRSA